MGEVDGVGGVAQGQQKTRQDGCQNRFQRHQTSHHGGGRQPPTEKPAAKEGFRHNQQTSRTRKECAQSRPAPHPPAALPQQGQHHTVSEFQHDRVGEFADGAAAMRQQGQHQQSRRHHAHGRKPRTKGGGKQPIKQHFETESPAGRQDRLEETGCIMHRQK